MRTPQDIICIEQTLLKKQWLPCVLEQSVNLSKFILLALISSITVPNWQVDYIASLTYAKDHNITRT